MKAAGVYDEAIIIVHGDHGARIALADPTAENLSRLTADDHIDNFSTLFAAKVPGLAPGIESGTAPISAILPYLFGDLDVPPPIQKRAEAYFVTDDDAYVKSPITLNAP